MATLSPYAIQQFFDNNGEPLAGGFLYTYEAGTTTPKVTYTDSAEGTANANPIVLDANGRADIWLDTGAYKFVLEDADNNVIDTVDDLVSTSVENFAGQTFSVSANTSIDASYKNALVNVTGNVTMSLLAASTAGDGFVVIFKNLGSLSAFIDPDGGETINGDSTQTIRGGESAICICNGASWSALIGREEVLFSNLDANFIASATSETITASDLLMFGDVTDSSNSKKTTAQGIVDIAQDIDGLSSATVATGDLIMINDIDDSDNPKKITAQSIANLALTISAEQTATGSETAFDFSVQNAKQISISLDALSLSGTDEILIQIGDAGGVETSGYSGGVRDGGGGSTNTSGFLVIVSAAAALTYSGVIQLFHMGGNKWSVSGVVSRTDAGASTNLSFGSKTLSAAITTIRITRNGSDTFDAGSVGVQYNQ